MAKAEVIITATDRTQAAIQSAQKGLKGLDNSAMLLNRTLGLVSGAAVGTFFLQTANQALTMADSINKAATRANITTEAMSELAYAAKLADADINQLVKAINDMQRGIGEAAIGTGEAKKGFEMLGISIKTLQDLSPEDQFKFLADAIMALENPTDRITVGTKIFKDAFAQLLPLFEEGSAGMNRAAEEARRLNIVVGQEQADAATQARDSVDRLTAAWDGFALQIMGNVAPALTTLLQSLTSIASYQGILDIIASVPSGGATLGTKIGQRMMDEAVAIASAQSSTSTRLGEQLRKTIINPADLNRTADALKRFRKNVYEIRDEIAKSADVDLVDAMGLKELNKQLQETTFKALGIAAENEFNILENLAIAAAQNIQTSFANFLFDPFSNGLKGMLKGFVDTIRRMIAEIAASMILTKFFTWMSGLGGFWGNVGATAMTALKPKAMGGPVMGGQPYMVGERGPELFVPGSNGSIVPNDKMGGMTIAPVYNIDARGATADLQKSLPGILAENNRRIFDELDRRYGIGR